MLEDLAEKMIEEIKKAEEVGQGTIKRYKS